MSEAIYFPERTFMQRHELEVHLEQTSSENSALSERQTFDTLGSNCRSALSRDARLVPSFTGHERRIPLVGRQRNASHPPEDEVRALNATFSIYCQRD